MNSIQKDILLLSSSDGAHTGRSGYGLLSQYLPEASVIDVVRNNAGSVKERVSDAVLSRLALSNWYRTSSFKLELGAIRYLKKRPKKIVHLTWGDRDIGFLDLFKKRMNFKICCSVHNCASSLNEIFNFPKRLKNIDAFILMSETQKKFFENIGIPKERLHVVLHGIDNHYFNSKNAPKQNETFNLLSVGSWKRDFYLLREVCIELQKSSFIHINIISSEKFRSLFNNLENVTFRNGLSDNELLKAYQEADCFLMTADDSSANNAILEAMACGLPIVAEDVGGIKEYTNEQCAVLTKPKNVNEIIQAILIIAESKSIQQKMAEAAKSRALELDWVKSADTLREIYCQLRCQKI